MRKAVLVVVIVLLATAALQTISQAAGRQSLPVGGALIVIGLPASEA